MKALLYITLFFCVFSCKKTDVTQNVEEVKDETSLKITKEDISKLNYTAFILDSRTKNSSEFWQKYAELDEVVSKVNQADLSFFKENNEVLIAFVKDLKETIPEEVDTPHINARLIALETQMLKLEGVANLSQPKKEEVLLVVRDFLTAFSNLNLQINKKIEKESQNIQKPY
ncbi:hypothetical protein Q4512_03920 [Oceanihabitans sp. 2_MG-2023]|uniref:hypothetical protein n=1 Tax=Oceanihabitans sp. 2_MG-2023 TaxID=3062661 RepID=UPI0026E3A1D1|nr:hypothetical protein [Oceanihabitans sp. 2_MG-2023]MDO6596048.1 hypothetical protein [Oceanihabitans sp. 2_MG-2023]